MAFRMKSNLASLLGTRTESVSKQRSNDLSKNPVAEDAASGGMHAELNMNPFDSNAAPEVNMEMPSVSKKEKTESSDSDDSSDTKKQSVFAQNPIYSTPYKEAISSGTYGSSRGSTMRNGSLSKGAKYHGSVHTDAEDELRQEGAYHPRNVNNNTSSSGTPASEYKKSVTPDAQPSETKSSSPKPYVKEGGKATGKISSYKKGSKERYAEYEARGWKQDDTTKGGKGTSTTNNATARTPGEGETAINDVGNRIKDQKVNLDVKTNSQAGDTIANALSTKYKKDTTEKSNTKIQPVKTNSETPKPQTKAQKLRKRADDVSSRNPDRARRLKNRAARKEGRVERKEIRKRGKESGTRNYKEIQKSRDNQKVKQTFSDGKGGTKKGVSRRGTEDKKSE